MKLSRAKILKSAVIAMMSMAVIVIAVVGAFFAFDHAYPPTLPGDVELSTEVVDSDGNLLRAFATSEGRWRLQVEAKDVDSEYIRLLISYEDQRFGSHYGVDPRAMLRAAGQFVTNGRIVSGGSTITMQLARLLEPRKGRSFSSKLHQMARAIQLELRLSKAEILDHYLMLAPYGGNLEGVRAASLAYFGKEPKGLTLAQSALLVALPQSPERRRPDRFPKRAKNARDTVLTRAANTGTIALSEVKRAARSNVSKRRIALPRLAAHLAQRLKKSDPDAQKHHVTLKRPLQRVLEKVAKNAIRRFDKEISIALVLADAKSGEILAEVGSPDYLDADRAGWVDMTRALRSPGSTLKPFIYGLAFEEGLIRPETLIHDSPANFAGYRPQNFDMQYQGEVSIKQALQLSLNVPAVLVLEAVGPARLMSKFKHAGINAVIPPTDQPGLSIGLGGIGVSLRDLTQLYTSLANGGSASQLHSSPNALQTKPNRLLTPVAAWHTTDILSGTPPPAGSSADGIAYKTGTSYGYRDAWSVGYDGRHVLGVWVGRADNGPVPGITGRKAAAPILFEAFEKTGLKRTPFKQAPAGALRVENAQLPITLQRFGKNFRQGSQIAGIGRVPELPPEFIYPPAKARVELDRTSSGTLFPLVMKLQNGRPPFRWLANGKILPVRSHNRVATWLPDGAGFSTLTVIDAGGRAASIEVYIQLAQK